MPPKTIRPIEKLASISRVWDPAIVGSFNGQEIRLAKLDGPFVWHAHESCDEVFICVEGRFRIEFRDGEACELTPGDAVVVPRGTEHRPVADKPAAAFIIDSEGTLNTGDAPSGAFTRDSLKRV